MGSSSMGSSRGRRGSDCIPGQTTHRGKWIGSSRCNRSRRNRGLLWLLLTRHARSTRHRSTIRRGVARSGAWITLRGITSRGTGIGSGIARRRCSVGGIAGEGSGLGRVARVTLRGISLRRVARIRAGVSGVARITLDRTARSSGAAEGVGSTSRSGRSAARSVEGVRCGQGGRRSRGDRDQVIEHREVLHCRGGRFLGRRNDSGSSGRRSRGSDLDERHGRDGLRCKASELLLLRRRGTKSIKSLLMGLSRGRAKCIESTRRFGGCRVAGKGVEVGRCGAGRRCGCEGVEVRSGGLTGGGGKWIRMTGTAAEGVIVRRSRRATKGVVSCSCSTTYGRTSTTTEWVVRGCGNRLVQTQQIQALRFRLCESASGSASISSIRLNSNRLNTSLASTVQTSK